MRKLMRVGLMVVAAAALAAACGEGRAIFNVDIFSFIGSGSDTLHYTVPPALSDTFAITPQEVTLLGGLQNSGVDSLRFTGTVLYENASGGPGTIAFQLFVDTLQVNVYSGSPVIEVLGTAGPALATDTVDFSLPVTDVIKDLFLQPTVFIGLRAVVDNPQASVLDGRVRLTALDMRLIVRDQVF